jgi:hypothetical protein
LILNVILIHLEADENKNIKTMIKKDKAILLQAWTGPEGTYRLRLPDFRQSAHGGGKVVSPTQLPPLPHPHHPGNIPDTHS